MGIERLVLRLTRLIRETADMKIWKLATVGLSQFSSLDPFGYTHLIMALPQSTNIIIIAVTFSVLAIVAVALRLRARQLQKARLGADDYLILPGLVSIHCKSLPSTEYKRTVKKKRCH